MQLLAAQAGQVVHPHCCFLEWVAWVVQAPTEQARQGVVQVPALRAAIQLPAAMVKPQPTLAVLQPVRQRQRAVLQPAQPHLTVALEQLAQRQHPVVPLTARQPRLQVLEQPAPSVALAALLPAHPLQRAKVVQPPAALVVTQPTPAATVAMPEQRPMAALPMAAQPLAAAVLAALAVAATPVALAARAAL
jgi:hypothetical protein